MVLKNKWKNISIQNLFFIINVKDFYVKITHKNEFMIISYDIIFIQLTNRKVYFINIFISMWTWYFKSSLFPATYTLCSTVNFAPQYKLF